MGKYDAEFLERGRINAAANAQGRRVTPLSVTPIAPKEKAKKPRAKGPCKTPVVTEIIQPFTVLGGVRFPIITFNELNHSAFRGNHHALSAYRRGIHAAVANALMAVAKPALPVVVRLTRISPSLLDEHDGLRASLKTPVDAIAIWLGVDDGNKQAVEWKYGQEKCARGTMGVEIRFERKP